MTSVYVLYDDNGIFGIYSSDDKAREAKKRFGSGCVGGAVDLDAMPELIDGMYVWMVGLGHDKEVVKIYNLDLTNGLCVYEGQELGWWTDAKSQNLRAFYYKCLATTKEIAIEIARNHWFPCPPFEAPPVDPNVVSIAITAEMLCHDGTEEIIERARVAGEEEFKRQQQEIDEWYQEDRK